MASSPVRLVPPTGIAALRKQFSILQKYRCPICKGPLANGMIALDHDHENGMCRATLCQSCNVGEGKVKAGMLFRTPRGNLAFTDPIKWLRNLADYLEYHEKNPSGLIHPSFDTVIGAQKPKKGSTSERTYAKRSFRRR